MAVSLQQAPQDDENWRQGRLWNRPVDLPEEDASFHLCARHRAMKLMRSDFFDWPKDKELPPDTHFGLLAEVMERSKWCVFCRLIAQSVSHTSYADKAEVLGCWIADGVREGHDTVSLRLRILPELVRLEDAFAPFDVIPLGRAGSKAELFSGRKMQAGQINLSLLPSWYWTCQIEHSFDCAANTNVVRPAGTDWCFSPYIRLLDLKERCLVELVVPRSYVALSYVWGAQCVFKTLTTNILKLKRPGELLRHHHLFPKSIQDALLLTNILKHRYIWIDSLCIIQDSETDKAKQLAAMDQIYSRAALTIVAAGGDSANAGLPGLHPGSRHITQNIAEYSPELILMSLQPDCQVALETTTWNSRGWTYQERLLSRRYLFFVNDTVYFQCSRATWGEDYFAEKGDVVRSAPMMDVILSRSWQPPKMIRRIRYSLSIGAGFGMTALEYLKKALFPIYCRVITEYTARDMSYVTDRLNGILGVMNVLIHHGHIDFFHGLPRPLLEAAMLWRPQQNLTRVPDDNRTGRPYWPSWSWAGWTGGIGYDLKDDYNGHEPLTNGPDRTRTTTRLSLCYRDRLNPDPISDTTSLSNAGASASVDGLHIRTKVAKFRLTLFGRSGQSDDPPDLCHFRISCAASGPSRPVTPGSTGGDDEPWLGSIRLPISSRCTLNAEYEFIILSEAYNFSSDEIGRQASCCIEPWSIVNVMLITRMTRTADEAERWRVIDDSCKIPPVACEVERIGVGRMLKDAWSTVESFKDFILV
ncbi:heterokaryon incompatibility protein-domain-containing protein [Truncatella angustata]|uniref:Heterokaryon incompatibility protein-domain-containing protein n=1 Tax=Truncatella angustata TaxID=152316 RepID=A0A9P8UEW3_9PEZI|nr:heterokaryon incompatibility protein-domain-containing protein [Truncatella angustata]KAH6648703.1 heterokaryon incompatibility protein-domain-containing protein [Truncatella angustata]